MSKVSKYTLVYTLCLPTFVLSLYFEENRSGVDTFLNHHDYHTRLLTLDNDSVPFQNAASTFFFVWLFVWTSFFESEQSCCFYGWLGLLYSFFISSKCISKSTMKNSWSKGGKFQKKVSKIKHVLYDPWKLAFYDVTSNTFFRENCIHLYQVLKCS